MTNHDARCMCLCGKETTDEELEEMKARFKEWQQSWEYQEWLERMKSDEHY